MNNSSKYCQMLSKYRKALMGLAALFVFYFHTHACYLMDIGFLGVWEAYFRRVLFFGVDMFMLISGFGVVHSLKKNGITRFYINRLKRIYPSVIAVCIIMGMVDHWSIIEFFKRASGYTYFTMPGFFLWYFPAITILYFLSPLFNKILDKFNNSSIFICTFVIWYIIGLNLIDRQTPLSIWDFYGLLNRVPIYILGMYLGKIYVKIQEQDSGVNLKLSTEGFSKIEVMLWIGIASLGGFFAYVACMEGLWMVVPNSMCFLPSGMQAISCCVLLPVILEWLGNKGQISKGIVRVVMKVLEYFGIISFEFYLVQEWICGKLLSIVCIEGRLNSIKFNVICFFISAVCGSSLFYIIELVKRVAKKNRIKS